MSERKRFVGPEGAVKPVLNLEKYLILKENDILNENTLTRRDGRFPEQMRSLEIRPNVLAEAKGSCYLELGNTKLTCAVYGPRAGGKQGKAYSNRGSIYCEFDLLPFSQDKRRGFQREADEQEYAKLLQETLEPALRLETFPNSTVDVYINVLEDDGSVLAAAMTAASVAITLAAIEMTDLVIGTPFVATEPALLIDPSKEEESSGAARVTIAQLVNSGDVAQIYVNGGLDQPVLREAINLSSDASAAVHEYIKSIFIS